MGPTQASYDSRETHSSVVYFRGKHAYKIKKPLDLGFADFRSVEQRKRACERELVLNRRLAPDVYLDVLTVTDSHGAVCDYILKMRRMPTQLSLTQLIMDGQDVDNHLRALAKTIAAFHSSAETNPEIAAVGRVAGLRTRWQNVLTTARDAKSANLPPTTLDHISALVNRYLDGRVPLLDQRADQGLIKDGHGDLLAADIYCLPDKPRVLDCLDFDDQMRYLDVLDDVAFLAMDLEHLGRADLARSFVAWYLKFSGTPTVSSLEHHYIAYRATVRAAVSALGESQGLAESAANAYDFGQQALRHLSAAVVRMLVVGGPPGSGKTTLARSLADELGWTHIESDAVRATRSPSGPDRYSPQEKTKIYSEMLDQARRCLSFGQSVILDATWGQASHRAAATEIAAQTATDLLTMRCQLPASIAVQRVGHRLAGGLDQSEADERIARELAQDFEPWHADLPVSTQASAQDCARDALALLRDKIETTT